MASANSPSFARPPRPQQQTDPENRGSMLRASILESALELGIGSSRTVQNWMFNPADGIAEEEEEENQGIVSPSLTYASTATSEESNLSAGLAQRSQPGAGILLNSKGSPPLTLDTSVQYSPRNGLSPGGANTDRTLQFDLRTAPEPRAISPAPSQQPSLLKNKLRKTKPDGYESDGGYVSEGGKGKKEKKEKKERKEKEKQEKKDKKNKKKEKDKNGEGGGGATDHESDGGYLSEAALKKKKSKKEKKDKKDKHADSPGTDYETDKGYTSAFSRSRSRKQSVTSPASGDESDGGYLSEASSKKKRFFRLNSKSRKKQDSVDSSQDQPPPVPALPAMNTMTPPIYEMFSRANSPLPPDFRNTTPVPGQVRPSVDTFTSVDTTTTADTSVTTTDTSSTAADSDERPDSMLSTDGLTKAFRDAESVRSPSIDFLSTFRRANAGSPRSASRFAAYIQGESPESPTSPKSPVAAVSASKSVRARPKISAPNTSALTLEQKHVPVPLTLTPPTPTLSSYPAGHIPPSPDPDYVLVTPNPSTPTPISSGHQTSSSVGSNGGPPSPSLQRPKVLAYYDLPPPSPPPRGPLPDVPIDISRSTSPSWSMMDSSPRGPPPRPAVSPSDRANPAGSPLSRQLSREVPTITQPVPPVQRGRMSPFPTAPVLPREQTAPLVRQTSRLTKEAVTRHVLKTGGPASASPYTNGHSRWQSNELIKVTPGPASAQPYLDGKGPTWPPRDQLAVPPEQPRSASVLDTRRRDDHGHSWLAYDDDEQGDASDRELSAPYTRPGSTEPPEPSPDVNAILAGFRKQRDAQRAVRDDRARDTVAGIVAGYERDTMYLDAEDGGGDRSSVWSDADSRYSFLDDEKSAAIRAKFVNRVEAMYGKELIPPVPQLPS